MNRRQFLINNSLAAGSFVLLPAFVQSCASSVSSRTIENIWKNKYIKDKFKPDNVIIELVRLATLAPSAYNAQPWKFIINQNELTLKPDFERAISISDPDNREMIISLGAALQNILIGAEYYNLNVDSNENIPQLKVTNNSIFEITLKFKEKSLTYNLTNNNNIKLIAERQTVRVNYKKENFSEEITKKIIDYLQKSSLKTLMFSSQKETDLLADYIKEGNRILYDNSKWMDEMKKWIRFNDSEAEEMLDGLYAKAQGDSSVPGWIGRMFYPMTTTATTQTKSDIERLKNSSAFIAIFEDDNPKSWLETGKELQKLLLFLTSLQIKTSYLNQPCQVTALRKDFARELGFKGLLPQIVLRLGFGPVLPRSPRRRPEQVIIKG